jgi:hypothetical protein
VKIASKNASKIKTITKKQNLLDFDDVVVTGSRANDGDNVDGGRATFVAVL